MKSKTERSAIALMQEPAEPEYYENTHRKDKNRATSFSCTSKRPITRAEARGEVIRIPKENKFPEYNAESAHRKPMSEIVAASPVVVVRNCYKLSIVGSICSSVQQDEAAQYYRYEQHDRYHGA